MDALAFLAFNEAMTFLTITIAFAGMLPPREPMEWVMMFMMFFIMSFVWWLFLALAPFVFLVMYLCGEWKLSDLTDEWHEWPWNHFVNKPL